MTQIAPKNKFKLIVVAALLFSCSNVFVGCSAHKYNMMNTYLDSTKTIELNKYPFQYSEPTIKKYDVVRVQFAGMNPTVTGLLNSYGGAKLQTEMKATEGPEITGQQVDDNGNLDFPLIGKVRAEGLTKSQLRESLLKMVTPLLKDPFVFVELPKRGITILGEVKNPSTVVFPKERANLLETLAQVGFVTEFANLTKVKVYREDASGNRRLGHVNLEDTAFLSTEYFYPQPDDVVYVPARAEKGLRNIGQTYAQFATILLAITSLVVSLTH
jgi:polysaccharide biosynthesis/export protein